MGPGSGATEHQQYGQCAGQHQYRHHFQPRGHDNQGRAGKTTGVHGHLQAGQPVAPLFRSGIRYRQPLRRRENTTRAHPVGQPRHQQTSHRKLALQTRCQNQQQ
ncbi:hypothetical protein GCM10007071_21610 [Marinobacter zhanjiangensis]|uniref:Uncharacterized protein n=1 Tax=Marinobacter zhanjiangensis TaxID=578215 RepID=A0ABQ3B1S4_9GAMM|nr:hypothetical protein GCM10007071_21610 [Marinobacter zhanjiangensis]